MRHARVSRPAPAPRVATGGIALDADRALEHIDQRRLDARRRRARRRRRRRPCSSTSSAVGLQRDRQVVQHAQHRARLRAVVRQAPEQPRQSRPGAARRGGWSARRAAAPAPRPPAPAPAARAGARRPTARAAGACCQAGAFGQRHRADRRRPRSAASGAPSRPGAAGGRARTVSRTRQLAGRPRRAAPARPAGARGRAGRSARRSAPFEQDAAARVSGCRPASARSRVDLPAPFGPTMRGPARGPTLQARCRAAPRAWPPRRTRSRVRPASDARPHGRRSRCCSSQQQVAAAQHRGEHAHRQFLRRDQRAREHVGRQQQHARPCRRWPAAASRAGLAHARAPGAARPGRRRRSARPARPPAPVASASISTSSQPHARQVAGPGWRRCLRPASARRARAHERRARRQQQRQPAGHHAPAPASRGSRCCRA